MYTEIDNNRIKRYGHVLNDMLVVAEAQTAKRVRRPRRQIVDLLNAMMDTCMMLHCQISGGPQPKLHDLEPIKQQAARALASARRRE